MRHSKRPATTRMRPAMSRVLDVLASKIHGGFRRREGFVGNGNVPKFAPDVVKMLATNGLTPDQMLHAVLQMDVPVAMLSSDDRASRVKALTAARTYLANATDAQLVKDVGPDWSPRDSTNVKSGRDLTTHVLDLLIDEAAGNLFPTCAPCPPHEKLFRYGFFAAAGVAVLLLVLLVVLK